MVVEGSNPSASIMDYEETSETHNGKKVYKKEVYGRKRKHVKKNCENCGQKFLARIHKPGKTCSTDCKYEIQNTGKNNHKAKKKLYDEEKQRCSDCGSTENLRLHHVEEKVSNPSDMVTGDYRYEELEKELDKCVCVCESCHRKRHAGS